MRRFSSTPSNWDGRNPDGSIPSSGDADGSQQLHSAGKHDAANDSGGANRSNQWILRIRNWLGGRPVRYLHNSGGGPVVSYPKAMYPKHDTPEAFNDALRRNPRIHAVAESKDQEEALRADGYVTLPEMFVEAPKKVETLTLKKA